MGSLWLPNAMWGVQSLESTEALATLNSNSIPKNAYRYRHRYRYRYNMDVGADMGAYMDKGADIDIGTELDIAADRCPYIPHKAGGAHWASWEWSGSCMKTAHLQATLP